MSPSRTRLPCTWGTWSSSAEGPEEAPPPATATVVGGSNRPGSAVCRWRLTAYRAPKNAPAARNTPTRTNRCTRCKEPLDYREAGAPAMSSDARRDLAALRELTERLSQGAPLERALHEVTDTAVRVLPADHASIRVLDATRTILLAAA